MGEGFKIWSSLVILGTQGCSMTIPLGGDPDGRVGATATATVQGELVGFAAGDPEPVAVAVTWFPVQNRTEFGNYQSHIVVSELTSLEAGGSRRFSMELVDPPPPQAFVEYGYGEGIEPDYFAPYEAAFGTVSVLGVEQAGARNEVMPSDVRGAALDVGIIYFQRDGRPGDPSDDMNLDAESVGVPATRGYHLHTIEMPNEARAANRQCFWHGLCVEVIGEPDPVWSEFQEDHYPRCLEEVPGADRCRWVNGDVLTEDEAVENSRCRALMEQHRTNVNCELPFDYPRSPLGSDAVVTVDAQAKLWQWYFGM